MPDKTLQAKRKASSVDLAGHIEVCEMNYHRLLKMLPGVLQGKDDWQFQAGSQARITVTIRVKDRARYTTVVEIQQQHADLTLPAFMLRLCHDAEVAEVIAFDGHRNWQPQYDYPNPQMYQPDEKQELNRFLFDWLVFCRKHGLALTGNCESVLVSRKS